MTSSNEAVKGLCLVASIHRESESLYSRKASECEGIEEGRGILTGSPGSLVRGEHMPNEVPRELTALYYEKALTEGGREKLRGAVREACRAQGVEPAADTVELVALETAHKLLQRAAPLVGEVSTPEEFDSVVHEELQHNPTENLEELADNTTKRFIERHADYLLARRHRNRGDA
jgi:hypothetical protein